MNLYRISALLGVALTLASAGQAQQQPDMPLGLRLSQPVDLCSAGSETCRAPADLGLPGAANGLIIPEAAVPAIREMGRLNGGDLALAYTEGVSDKSILDLCSLCKCCVIEHDALALEPQLGKDPGLPEGLIVIWER